MQIWNLSEIKKWFSSKTSLINQNSNINKKEKEQRATKEYNKCLDKKIQNHGKAKQSFKTVQGDVSVFYFKSQHDKLN